MGARVGTQVQAQPGGAGREGRPGLVQGPGEAVGPHLGDPGSPDRRAPHLQRPVALGREQGPSACGREDTDARPAGRGEPGGMSERAQRPPASAQASN